MDDVPGYLSISKVLSTIVIVVILSWLFMWLSGKLAHVLRNYMIARADDAEDVRRIETLVGIFRHIATILIVIAAGIMLLIQLDISIAPILGAAGVVGLAVGFGAQNLIKDYFNGFFILWENQINQGDAVEVCGKTGVVEEITLRYVCLRNNEGNVHYIPNSQITTVTNKSRDYAYALIDLGVAYRENLEEVYSVIRKVSDILRNDPEAGPKILDDVEIQGVQEWGASEITIRCRFRTSSLEQWSVRRAFLGHLKNAFDEHGIEIPYPHLTIFAGKDKAGKSTPFQVSDNQEP